MKEIFCVPADLGVVILKDSDVGPLLAEVGKDISLHCNYEVIKG